MPRIKIMIITCTAYIPATANTLHDVELCTTGEHSPCVARMTDECSCVDCLRNDQGGYVRPHRHGVRESEDGTGWERWAVFHRDDVSEFLDDDDPDDDPAAALTGWHRSYGGPGRRYSDDPTLRVSTSRVLVTQTGGLDV